MEYILQAARAVPAATHFERWVIEWGTAGKGEFAMPLFLIRGSSLKVSDWRKSRSFMQWTANYCAYANSTSYNIIC